MLLVAPALASFVAASSPAYDNAFWQQWGDGKAELDGYALSRVRYGEKRTGTVVAIFVTEPYSPSHHVKAEKNEPDAIQALKLNLVEDFQTGIYDYNLMTSSWTALTGSSVPLGTAPKVAFSSQEWCGTTYTDVVFDPPSSSSSSSSTPNEIVRSYFDGESGARTLENKAKDGGLVEDALLVWARGLASPAVARGASTTVAFLPSLESARLHHVPLAWTTAKLARDDKLVDVDVPAGHFSCERAVVDVSEMPGGFDRPNASTRHIEIFVEAAAPDRIVKLVASDGYELALTGTIRTAYWTKNHEGDEALLQQLGFHPPRSR